MATEESRNRAEATRRLLARAKRDLAERALEGEHDVRALQAIRELEIDLDQDDDYAELLEISKGDP